MTLIDFLIGKPIATSEERAEQVGNSAGILIFGLDAQNPGRRIVTIIPELVERRWYAYFLHAQRAALLKTMLLMKGNHCIPCSTCLGI